MIATMTWMARGAVLSAGMLAISPLTASLSVAQDADRTVAGGARPCTGDNGGITLPPGFCATVFADNIGHARQMVVAGNGVLYVNTWSGRYYRNDKPPAGGFLIAQKDTTGNGRADVVVRFGPGTESGNAGGTGIALCDRAHHHRWRIAAARVRGSHAANGRSPAVCGPGFRPRRVCLGARSSERRLNAGSLQKGCRDDL
jgi:hypothetical protein